MPAVCTCTLTIKDDHNGEYEDDLLYQRGQNQHVEGRLGGSRLTRSVVRLLNRWVATYEQCGRNELKVLGSALYEIAFGSAEPFTPADPPTLQSAFERTLQFCQDIERPLRLRLVLGRDAVELGRYPWEFLYMNRGPDTGFFLAGEDTRLTLTRYVPNSDVWQPAPEDERDGRLRVLIVVSTPTIPGMTDLKVGGFVEQLGQLDAKRFRTETLVSPTRTSLRGRVESIQPHVIHFIGHGRPGWLALRKDEATLSRDREDRADQVERGLRPPEVSEADWTDAPSACGIFRAGLERKDAPPRLVFLHACEGATAEQTQNVIEGFGDVARELVSGDRITGVVAMQYTIQPDEAELFAKAFYRFISDGRPIDEAMTAARKDFAETRPGMQAWDSRGFGTPVIYLRREDALVRPPSPAVRAESESAQTAGAQPRGKEPCPNPLCPGGYVIRTAALRTCRACGYPFTECPKCDIGLVVPRPTFGCSNCDFVYSARTAGGEGGPAPTAPAALGEGAVPAPSRSSSVGPVGSEARPTGTPVGQWMSHAPAQAGARTLHHGPSAADEGGFGWAAGSADASPEPGQPSPEGGQAYPFEGASPEGGDDAQSS